MATKTSTEAEKLIDRAREARVVHRATTRRDPRQHADWGHLTEDQQEHALELYRRYHSHYVDGPDPVAARQIIDRDRTRARNQAEKGKLHHLTADDLALFSDTEIVELVELHHAGEEKAARRREAREQHSALREMIGAIRQERAQAEAEEIEAEARKRLGI